MNSRQEKSVEELLRSSAQFSDGELENFAEKYSPVSEEQKERIINKGLEKLAAIEKNESAETEENTEEAVVVEVSRPKVSWIRTASAAACVCIAAGAVLFAGSRLEKNTQVMDAPEVSDVSVAVTEAEMKEETSYEAVTTAVSSKSADILVSITQAVTESEKTTPAVTQISSASETSEKSVSESLNAENTASETMVSVTSAPENTEVQETENTQNTQVVSDDWTVDGTVLTFREGVKCISDKEFDKVRTTITSVVIPDGAEEIQELAFAGFNALEEIIIPDSVRKIGNYAFMNCSSLRVVELPSSLELYSSCIFNGCEIEKLVINSGSMICMNASATGSFYKKLCIDTVVISEKAGRLSDDFALPVLNAEKLVLSADAAETLRNEMLYFAQLGSVVIPEGTSCLQDKAFSMVTVPEITIPSTVKSLGEDVFENLDCGKITVLNPELELEGKLDGFKGTLCGYKGSSAEKYAEKNGCEFQIIG